MAHLYSVTEDVRILTLVWFMGLGLLVEVPEDRCLRYLTYTLFLFICTLSFHFVKLNYLTTKMTVLSQEGLLMSGLESSKKSLKRVWSSSIFMHKNGNRAIKSDYVVGEDNYL